MTTKPAAVFQSRRSVAFRLVASALVWASLFDVLPATAFTDLSVQARVPVAEWRAATRRDLGT